MTKTWETVREETCRLYSEGRSLEYIRKHLLRERHFEASTRAFRLKLKAWKAKRSDSACSVCGSIPHEQTQCATSEVPGPPLPLPSPRDILGEQLGRLSAKHSGADHSRSSNKRPLASIYEELIRAQRLGDQAAQGLAIRQCDFVDGATSILHYAAKEPQRDGRHAVILKVIAHMERQQVSIDEKDEMGQTALEIAIKTNQSALVKILLEHNAPARQQGSQGHQPLHLALQAGASATIHSHLLTHGAGPNVIMLRYQRAITPLSFAIDRLAQESVQTPRVLDGNCLKWFDIIANLMRHGAGFGTTDLKSIIRLFNRYWHLSQGSEELLSCARPVLRAYFKSGLDPTRSVSSNDTDCLAHSAFHHSQNNSLATLVVEEANLQKHGSEIARYTLTTSECSDCPYPTPNRDEALRMLFEELERSQVRLDFDPLIECLTKTSEDHKVDFLRTIQELQPEHHQQDTFQRRDIFVNAMATLSSSVKFDIAEILLKPEGCIDQYEGLADIMRSVKTALMTYASFPEMIEASMYGFLGFCDCSKTMKQEFVHCVVHVATKEAIRQLDQSRPGTREQLGRLVALREWYRLPGLDIPQDMLATALGGVVDGRRTYVPGSATGHRPELNDGIKGWCFVGLES